MIPSAGLHALIENGVIDDILRPLKSGKEASAYIVRAGGKLCCAKGYKNMAHGGAGDRCRWRPGAVLG